MAWEWVAPVATGAAGAVGVGFTWLAGAQSRIHAERMVEHNQLAEERARLLKERRDAYFAFLHWIDLVSKRAEYVTQGDQDKLQQFDEQWPWGKRIDWTIDVLIGVQTFGSERVFQLAEDWMDAHDAELRDVTAELRKQLRAVVRDELQGLVPQRDLGRNRR
ncbi:hypothetical protein ETD83_28305 [Actinomadura soli]|uniref:Uncharacterized protein n=1 Tax=Actinomadura soli TaxID=2508997 RepID=A0A5C4J586_9ACTN|nr:hypothetical protein [Actinomadura soli]TMQ92029.1 hypothetical protein ETD83_28305 [Actinomadura soli]